MKVILGIAAALLVVLSLGTPTYAQTTVACEQDYTVVAGDWLSKLAEKFYSSPSDYLALATQTNLKSETDVLYATIVNPDSINVGWKLCVPTKERAAELNGASPPPGLDQQALANASYRTAINPDQPLQLMDGKYSEPAAPGSASMNEIVLTDQIAYGEVDGVPSAAVVTGATGGGSGFFYDVHLMQVKDGKATEIGVHSIGDRSPVIATIFEGNQIKVDFITQGPDQPFCCGTLRMLAFFKQEGAQLTVTDQKELGNLGPNGETPGQPLFVSGTVTYRERIAMPPNAVVKVQVADISKADAPAEVIGEQVIDNPGNVPVAFRVPYDASKIVDNNTYAVSARIDVDGKLMWINTQRYTVITNGNPTSDIEVLVERVGQAAQAAPTTASETPAATETPAAPSETPAATETPATAPSLTGTEWQWQSTTTPAGEITVTDPTRYTLTFNTDGRVAIKADCNNATTTYTVDGDKITFGPIATTLMACPPGSQDSDFIAGLSAISTYKLDGSNLSFELSSGGTMKFAK